MFLIAEIIRFLSFLAPIPFMLLFYVRSDKLEFLKRYVILTFFVPVFLYLLFQNNIGYNIELITAYLAFVVMGALGFSENYSFTKSLCLSFCLVYFGSFLWEIPYHVYTIIVRGGIDGAFPLHILFVFPMWFVYEKFSTNKSVKQRFLVSLTILGFSCMILFYFLVSGYDVWNSACNPMSMRIYEESLWMVSRIVAMFGLFYLYSKSTLRLTRDKK